ncbi:WXG100 family type VII secretion target [Actinoplanes sp. HUAS TT8]|uniref:WXG100 family type VII secretion target n=1 Tax=Actinoplanes sp. HUAS TT8 TaxID=3447453 RepID=UPI003F525DDB
MTSLVAAPAAPAAATDATMIGDMQELVAEIRGGEWVDTLLTGATTGISVASAAVDPLGTLLANGLAWAMEYFEPLRHMLDELTGAPERVAAHAATWQNIAAELDHTAADLQRCLSGDLLDWQGTASAAYSSMMSHNVTAIGILSGTAAAMSAATEAAGNLVRFTRDIVRDLIADLVSRVVVWAVEAMAVITIPAVAAQIVVAVAKWGARIAGYTTALTTSLTNLAELVGG